MIGLLLKAGYELEPEAENADFLVVNTCGFLEAARQEGFETIGHLFSTKKEGAKVIVAGCMVKKCRSELEERFPEIHAFLGSGDVEKIVQAVEKGETEIGSAKSFLEWGEVPRRLATPKHYAYLKIAEGCKKRCAFCIIPTIKGPLRSKTEEQVLKEFSALLSQGVFEVILIAQDLGDFGKDRREKGALAALLRKMLERRENFWIRLLYLYPDEVDAELIEVMQSDPRICRYLDMPIQHIDDEILRAMHRKTSKKEILATLSLLREKMPDIVIRTSLMVGFPGETEEHFQELLQFVKKAALDQVGIFSFSLEKEAYAARLANQVPEEIKRERLERLAAAQQKVVAKKLKKWVGRKVVGIVDRVHPESPYLLIARHQGQCPEIDGQILLNDTAAVESLGGLYEIEITAVAGYDLVGSAIQPVRKKGCSPLQILSV